jgi:hypothetical protein
MTSIFYKLINNFGEMRKITGGGSDSVRIHVEGAESGIITVGNVSAPLKSGVARLSLLTLADGEYTPTLYKSGSITVLEALSKCGSRISAAGSGALLRRIALRTEALEERLEKVEERCASYESAIYGKPLL